MRAVIQRVSHANITIDGVQAPAEQSAIGLGFVILLGVGQEDTEAQADKLWGKISKMRIFADEAGKTNLALADVSGEVMVVSQFTLYADCKKGNRPSFTGAGDPKTANRLYEYFVSLARRDVPHVVTGSFGADMQIELCNDGPFTILLDTDTL